MEHTKGEWTVVSDDSMYGTYTIYEVAEQHSKILIGEDEAEHKQVTAEDNANARLIASAPDLLEACKEALEFAKYNPEFEEEGLTWVKSVRNAIKQAEEV